MAVLSECDRRRWTPGGSTGGDSPGKKPMANKDIAARDEASGDEHFVSFWEAVITRVFKTTTSKPKQEKP